jgi:hypothetical protein
MPRKVRLTAKCNIFIYDGISNPTLKKKQLEYKKIVVRVSRD